MKNLTKWLSVAAIGAAMTLFMAGCEIEASVSVGTIHTVTYVTGEGSGTPPAAQEIMYNESILLPGQESMIAPSGKYFNGWRDDVFSYYSAGVSYTVTGNVTFTAQWSASSTPPPPPTAEAGVYVGLISFSGTVTDLASNRLVYLDAAGKSTLTSLLDSQYRKSSEPGTALFYGVHKALANLSTNADGTSLPAEVQSVSILTFTDGLDNASFGASNTAPIEGKSGVLSADYASYVNGQFATRQIKGKLINAYSAGVMGSDVQETVQFNQNLTNIASSPSNVHALTDFANLQGVFSDIANNLDVSHSSSKFSMTTTQNDPGTIVRMTFDISGINPTPAQAEQSTRWIEGTLNFAGGTWTLDNIRYSSGMTSSNDVTTLTGTVSGPKVVFVFENLTGYNSSTDAPKQWTRTPGAPSWQINSEYNAAGSTTTTIEKRTALIYLVLDASTSLSDDQVGQIRTAAKNFIDTLYTRSGAGPQTQTRPSAPTNVRATPLSQTEISVTWNPVAGATSYNVYWASEANGTYKLDGPTTETTFTSTGWGNLTAGYFKVTAVNAAGESSPSAVASANLNSPPAAPTGVTATAISSESIRVSWTPVPMATSYQVYYSYSALGEYRREGDPVTTTSFISDDLWESGLFFFKVIAVNAAGESPFSDFASVTTFSSTGSAGMPWGTYSPVALASANGWRNYTLSPAYDEHWFKVTTTEANYSHAVVAARDRQNIGGGKTADVILEAYGSVDGTFQLYVDAGAGTNTTASAEYITFSSPGTLYIRVVAKNDSNDNAGTYSIYFNTAAR